MRILSSITNAIFGIPQEDKKAPVHVAPPAPTTPASSTPFNRPATQAIDEVDVEARLDAKEGADALNWRTSITDLMKLVGLEPSFANRKELAQELGDTDYTGTAEENIWLHKQVMTKLAANGGRVPASLRD